MSLSSFCDNLDNFLDVVPEYDLRYNCESDELDLSGVIRNSLGGEAAKLTRDVSASPVGKFKSTSFSKERD